jgi:DNA ligase (NAD+)
MTDTQRIEFLRRELSQHSFNYYVLNAPTITDPEYDQWFKELQDLEARYPELADANSPTAKVGARGLNNFQKVKHDAPMLSLENTFTAKDAVHRIVSEAGPCEVIFEPKIDGLACSLKYVNGKLVQAVTRGDHEVGDDITINARTVKDLPMVIAFSILPIEIRGEIYLAKEDFAKLNSELEKAGEELFANARNAAAGSLKQKSSVECAKRNLRFIAYSVANPEVILVPTQSSLLDWLFALRFNTAKNHAAVFSIAEDEASVSKVQTYLAQFDVYRKSLPFDTDGCVIKVNSIKSQIDLGNKTRAPRWATAFKFAEEEAVTTLKAVTLQVGRTGCVTPVAEVDPVSLCGATVKRSTLCNQEEINRLGINVGDKIKITRSGAVIPKIMGLSQKIAAGVYQMPQTCPCCSTTLVRHGVHWFCPNETGCTDQVVQRMQHAVGKGCLDLDGFGSETVVTAVEFGFTKLSMLFSVTDYQIEQLFKPAFARKFKKERERVKTAPLWRKIAALGIEGVGQTSCKELCEKYHSISEMIAAGKTQVEAVLGPVATTNFIAFIQSHVAELEVCEQYGFKFSEVPAQSTAAGPLSGKTFCITGGLTTGTRTQVSAFIEKMGGTMKSCGKSLNYLVVGEGGGDSKANAAKKFGITCISEEDLYKLAGVPMPVIEVSTTPEW